MDSFDEDAFSAAKTLPVEMSAMEAMPTEAVLLEEAEPVETMPNASTSPFEGDEKLQQGEIFPVPITRGPSSHRRRRLAAALVSTSESEDS